MIGLKDEVTAITLVTFGTSQIDLFASRIAAVNDPTADNSIGNVVAANAIGVFLGESTSPFHYQLSKSFPFRVGLPLARGIYLLGILRSSCWV